MFSSESRPGEAINYTALLLKEQKTIFQDRLSQKEWKGKKNTNKINPTSEGTGVQRKRHRSPVLGCKVWDGRVGNGKAAIRHLY